MRQWLIGGAAAALVRRPDADRTGRGRWAEPEMAARVSFDVRGCLWCLAAKAIPSKRRRSGLGRRDAVTGPDPQRPRLRDAIGSLPINRPLLGQGGQRPGRNVVERALSRYPSIGRGFSLLRSRKWTPDQAQSKLPCAAQYSSQCASFHRSLSRPLRISRSRRTSWETCTRTTVVCEGGQWNSSAARAR